MEASKTIALSQLTCFCLELLTTTYHCTSARMLFCVTAAYTTTVCAVSVITFGHCSLLTCQVREQLALSNIKIIINEKDEEEMARAGFDGAVLPWDSG